MRIKFVFYIFLASQKRVREVEYSAEILQDNQNNLNEDSLIHE